jgi:FkbM family methyltransferase
MAVEKKHLAWVVMMAFVVFIVIPGIKHVTILQDEDLRESREVIRRHREHQLAQLVPQRTGGGSPMVGVTDVAEPAHQEEQRNDGAIVSTSNFSTPQGVGCYKGTPKAWRPGKCSDDNAWLVPWMATRPGSDWIAVDVGANKGYVIAGWLETLLGPDRTPFTPHNLGVSIYTHNTVKEGYLNLCGGCTECIDPPVHVPQAHRASKVKVYAFEPSVANFKWLSFFYNDSTVVNVTNAAVSHTPSTAYFPDGVLGKETGKVSSVPVDGYVPVKIVSLDAFLGSSNIKHVDILCTDAEGFDQEVAKGARQLLEEGRVGIYQFEMYRAEDYKSIFERLYRWGYVCYYFTEARRGSAPWLIRISGCWQDYFQNLIGWVNGLCYNTRVPELAPIFDKLTMKMHRNQGPARVKALRGVLGFVDRYVPKREKEAGAN